MRTITQTIINKATAQHPGFPPDVHGLTVRIVQVTPELAKVWLERNTMNRKEKRVAQRKFARDMMSGHWPLTGQPILFDWNGRLLDGQNRLRACVTSGSAFWTVVIWGVCPDVFKYLDQGTKRTSGDALGIAEIPNANVAAAACQFVWRYERGLSLGNTGRGAAATTEEVFATYDSHPELQNSLKWAKGAVTVGLRSGALAVFIHWRLSQLDPDRANRFFEALYLGVGAFENTRHPILVLKTQLLTAKTRKTFDLNACVAYVFKTWSAWVSGKPLGKLVWDVGNHVLPVPIDPRKLANGS